MYLETLFDIKDDIPDITSKNISHIDNFLGSIGKSNLFYKKDFLITITQKSISEQILYWLCEKNIIDEKTVICPNCKQETNAKNEDCSICSNHLSKDLEICSYEICADLNYSDLEKEAIKNKNDSLNDISYKLLCTRLNQKIRNHDKAYIIFIDLAASTELGKKNKYEQSSLIHNIHVYFKTLMKSFYRKYSGIYIKSDGDSCWIYLDNIQCVKEFFTTMINTIYQQDFVSVMKDLNISLDLNLFLKIYLSNSVIGEFIKTDKHSIDFAALDAMTYISRIEKAAKKKILSDYSEKNNFPFFVVSTDNDYGKNCIHLDGITNFENGFDVWYSDVNELKNMVNNS